MNAVLRLQHSVALVTDSPGRVIGMYNSVPSFSIGMNSLPSFDWPDTRDAARMIRASTNSQPFPAQHAGDHRAVQPDQQAIQWIALFGNEPCPRMNSTISAGTRGHDRNAAPAIAKVLV
jgi:hypothetical protein